MSSTRFRRSGLLASVAALALLGGCGDSRVTLPGADSVTVEVTPAGPIEIEVGGSVMLVAQVGGAGSPGEYRLTFASADTAVATVSGEGVVSGVSPGTTSITVGVEGVASARASVLVEVLDPLDTPPTTRTPAVSIEGLQQADGTAVGTDSVRGTVFARLDVERGNAARFEVLLDSLVACAQDFTVPAPSLADSAAASRAAARLVCSLNTARFDTITGVPVFPNGRSVLSARLVGANGSVLARADGVPLTLGNPDRLLLSVSTERIAADTTGRNWRGGDVTVRALPVIYRRGLRAGSVSFSFATGAGEPLVVVDRAAPFEAVLGPDGALRGVTADSLRISASSTTQSGDPGPSTTAPALRYDAAPPPAGSLREREWVGADFAFGPLYSTGGERDAGVGGGSVRFFAGDPALSPAELVAAGEPVVTGDDLAPSPAQAYELSALACDALENCVVVPGFRFGVDLAAPSIDRVSVADRAVNPEGEVVLTLSDEGSGFGSLPVLASVTRLAAGLASAECGPTVGGVDLPGRAAAGACASDTTASVLPVPGTAGYYTYSVRALDRAGNEGEAVVRTLLIDRTPPTVEEISLPAQLTPGSPVTIGAVTRDDVDLLTVSALLAYPTAGGGRIALPFAAPDTAGTPFDATLATRFTASLTLPFVSTLTFPDEGRVDGAVTFAADSLRVAARDVAGWRAERGRGLSVSAPAGNPFASVDSVHTSLDLQNVCTSGCLPSDPRGATLTARLTGAPGVRNPFAEGGRVYFFLRDASGRVVLLGSAGTASQTETGDRRTFAYSVPIAPPPGLAGDFTLFAVGARVTGNGLHLGEASLRLFGR